MLRVHALCDRGMAGFVYPDGRSLLDQPVLLLDAFAVIADQKARVRKDAQD